MLLKWSTIIEFQDLVFMDFTIIQKKKVTKIKILLYNVNNVIEVDDPNPTLDLKDSLTELKSEYELTW